MKIGKGDLTNGEIVSLKELKIMFDLIKSHGGMQEDESSKELKFYDLGSGVGKPVIAAALLYAFESCIGIEIQNILYEKSKELYPGGLLFPYLSSCIKFFIHLYHA